MLLGDGRAAVAAVFAPLEARVIKAVVFDVGETLEDETREYGTWADWFGVPWHAFSAVFGAVIALGLDYRQAFGYFQPGFDLAAERQRRAEAGQPETFGEAGLYPDVRPCLAAPGRSSGPGGCRRLAHDEPGRTAWPGRRGRLSFRAGRGR
jgi:hypothetical protein